ncbi:hypothetical protein D3C72_2117460 [compost metagenome]
MHQPDAWPGSGLRLQLIHARAQLGMLFLVKLQLLAQRRQLGRLGLARAQLVAGSRIGGGLLL